LELAVVVAEVETAEEMAGVVDATVAVEEVGIQRGEWGPKELSLLLFLLLYRLRRVRQLFPMLPRRACVLAGLQQRGQTRIESNVVQELAAPHIS
jgi:hypothetical protein